MKDSSYVMVNPRIIESAYQCFPVLLTIKKKNNNIKMDFGESTLNMTSSAFQRGSGSFSNNSNTPENRISNRTQAVFHVLCCDKNVLCQSAFDVPSCFADETITLSAVLERLNPHLAQIKVLHRVFCTGVAEVPPQTPNVVRASHLLNTLYKAIIEYDSVGEASEQVVSLS